VASSDFRVGRRRSQSLTIKVGRKDKILVPEVGTASDQVALASGYGGEAKAGMAADDLYMEGISIRRGFASELAWHGMAWIGAIWCWWWRVCGFPVLVAPSDGYINNVDAVGSGKGGLLVSLSSTSLFCTVGLRLRLLPTPFKRRRCWSPMVWLDSRRSLSVWWGDR